MKRIIVVLLASLLILTAFTSCKDKETLMAPQFAGQSKSASNAEARIQVEGFAEQEIVGGKLYASILGHEITLNVTDDTEKTTFSGISSDDVLAINIVYYKATKSFDVKQAVLVSAGEARTLVALEANSVQISETGDWSAGYKLAVYVCATSDATIGLTAVAEFSYSRTAGIASCDGSIIAGINVASYGKCEVNLELIDKVLAIEITS